MIQEPVTNFWPHCERLTRCVGKKVTPVIKPWRRRISSTYCVELSWSQNRPLTSGAAVDFFYRTAAAAATITDLEMLICANILKIFLSLKVTEKKLYVI